MLAERLLVSVMFPFIFLVNGTWDGKVSRSAGGPFWGLLPCLLSTVPVQPAGYGTSLDLQVRTDKVLSKCRDISAIMADSLRRGSKRR